MSKGNIDHLEQAADAFLASHGVNPHRAELEEPDPNTINSDPDKLVPTIDSKSAGRARLIKLLEGEAAPDVMRIWNQLPEDLQAGVIENLVLGIEEQSLDKGQLIQKFARLIQKSKEFLEFDRPPSDAHIGKLPSEEVKLRKEVTEHLKKPGPSIEELIAIMENRQKISERPNQTIQ